MKLFCTLAISAFVLAPVPASAQDPDGKRPRARSEEVGDGTRMICRTTEIIGSRIKGGRICMTADEWAAAKREARLKIEEQQQRRSTQF